MLEIAADYFLATAVRALVLNYAGIAADGVAVDGMIDGEIAHVCVVHGADEPLEGFDILRGVGIHLDVSDMPRVAEFVIGSLDFDFV